MDIGSSSYTEFDWADPALLKFMKEHNLIRHMKMMIHSHHNMSAFFSGVDVAELHANTPNHNVYISLIVNNQMNNVARMAYIDERSSEIIQKIKSKRRNLKGEFVIEETEEKYTEEEKYLCYNDMEIIYEGIDKIQSRLEFLENKKTKTSLFKQSTANNLITKGRSFTSENRHKETIKSPFLFSDENISDNDEVADEEIEKIAISLVFGLDVAKKKNIDVDICFLKLGEIEENKKTAVKLIINKQQILEKSRSILPKNFLISNNVYKHILEELYVLFDNYESYCPLTVDYVLKELNDLLYGI